MAQYIIAFSLYTLAMIGIFFIAFVVYKKTMGFSSSRLNNGMKIEDALRLSQRKTLYIINVQGERFLIASDVENTTFLAKLSPKEGLAQGFGAQNPNLQNINTTKTGQAPKISLEKQNFGPIQLSKESMPENTPDETEQKKQVEKYIKELETLNIANNSTEQDEEEYSNAVDIKNIKGTSKKTIMKNILKELENSKRTNI